MPKPKTVTERKIQANRANSQHSTGPCTPEGKQRVSRNALKHGLLARKIVMPKNDPHEDPDQFDQLLTDLIKDLKPQTRLEQLTIERIAVAYWRLQRAYTYEIQAIKNTRNRQKDNLAARILGPLVGPLVGPLAESLAGPTNPEPAVLPANDYLDKLIRYETLIDRELNRAMIQLNALQAARQIHQQNQKNEKNLNSQPVSNPEDVRCVT